MAHPKRRFRRSLPGFWRPSRAGTGWSPTVSLDDSLELSEGPETTGLAVFNAVFWPHLHLRARYGWSHLAAQGSLVRLVFGAGRGEDRETSSSCHIGPTAHHRLTVSQIWLFCCAAVPRPTRVA